MPEAAQHVRFGMMLEAIGLAVLLVDAEGCVSYLNAAAEEWLGMSRKSAQGRSLAALFPDPHLFSVVSRVRDSQASISEYDYALPITHGVARVNFHLAPLGEGEVVLVFARKQFVPEQQKEAARGEMVRASGLIAAMLAHEVKNPLAGIRGAAQLLEAELPPEQAALAALIRSEVDRISGVLAQVEPFSTESSLPLVAVNVHETLHYIMRVAEAGAARAITLSERFDPSLPLLMTEPGALAQLLLNLVKNACEAGANVVTLITTSRQEHEVMGKSGPIRPQGHIIIQDNGPGIAKDVRARLFEPFASSKREPGRGLGLAISAKLAEDMGGALTLESSEPGCTRFRLTLRVA